MSTTSVEEGELGATSETSSRRGDGRGGLADAHLTVWDIAVALLIVAIGIWLRHSQLGPRSLWLDDAWVALVHKTGWAEVTKVGLTAPGFAAALKAWLHVTGFSATRAQSLAFVFGTAAPALLWLLCLTRRLGRPAAAVAAAVLLTSPAHIVYSARVKQYTLDSVLVIALVWLTWRAIERPDDTRRWVLLALGAAFATVISSGVVPVVVGAFLAAVLALTRVDTRTRRRAFAAGAVYVVFAGAWWRVVLQPRLGSALREYWRAFYISTSDPGAFASGLRTAATRLTQAFSDLPSVAMLALLVAASVVVVRTRRELSIVLLGPLLVAVILAVFKVAPIGTGRTDLYLYPLFALLLGVAVSEIAVRHWYAKYFGIAVIVASLALARPPGPYPPENLRRAVRILSSHALATDTIIVYSGGRYAFALYAPRQWPVTVFTSKAQTNGFDVRIHRSRLFVLDSYRSLERYRTAVERVTRGAGRVWFVGSHGRLDVLDVERALYDSRYRAVYRARNREAWFVSLWVKLRA